jgi:predicted enzyme related to lactoylglutathione lyase
MSNVAAISIYVDDLKAARKFYERTLGFAVAAEHPGIVELRNEGVSLVLCEGPPRERPAYPAGVILGVAVKSLEGSLKELSKQGVALVHDTPQPFPMGRFAACLDPAGNAVELLEFAR